MSDNGYEQNPTEFSTMVLGPYDLINPSPPLKRDPYPFTFPVLPQVRTGMTKVFPPRETLGPPDPNVDDTLSTLNFMDLTGGQGVSRINPSTDINRFWWGTADTRDADGWTTAPEAVAAKPAVSSGNCIPIGRIGTGAYALWGLGIHRWNSATGGWGDELAVLPFALAADANGTPLSEGIVIFRGAAWIPLGANGYAELREDLTIPASPDVTVTHHLGVATPTPAEWAAATDAASKPKTNPRVQIFGIHQQNLYALTIEDEDHTVAESATGANDSWKWLYNDAISDFTKITTGTTPRVLVNWKRPADGAKALWCLTQQGGLILDRTIFAWEETDLWDVPPHPNFGRCAKPWRPGEALWVATGGGDALQYTASGVAQPSQGPGGRAQGLPAGKRGDIVSFASDLANLYALVQGDTDTGATSIVEDASSGDALVIPDVTSISSVIANTGIGWHPLWESDESSAVPTRIVTADSRRDDNTVDYRVFWGVGDQCWSMQCRLSMYSARQGRQVATNTRYPDRFAIRSGIEWGEFNAGSISNKKHFSHVAILLEQASDGVTSPRPQDIPPPPAPPPQWVEYEYQTDTDGPDDWHTVSLPDPTTSTPTPIIANTPNSRTIIPFGLSNDGNWSAGLAAYWIKQRIWLNGPGGVYSPVVQAVSLAYMPLPANATHQVYTVPMPVEVDERSGKTKEQIYAELEAYLESEVMLFLQFQERTYRAYVAGLSFTEIAGDDFVGAATLNVIQIATGRAGLVGE